MEKVTKIIKYSGEVQAFDINKLIDSLRYSRADEAIIMKIAKEIQSSIKDGMTTKHIYQMAYKMLKQKTKAGTARYKLKKAIMELGPSGYPFERFIGKILESEGFETNVSIVMQGHCVKHEVDVSALKDNNHFLIECKFHSVQGRFCNVKIPLYIQSRFKDLEKQWLEEQDHSLKLHKGWVYTNTRFSMDAIQYAECSGLGLLGWDYPENNNLKNRIDFSGLHPITCLVSLTKKEKQLLLDKGIVLSKELCGSPSLLNSIGIKEYKQKSILEEAHELCKN